MDVVTLDAAFGRIALARPWAAVEARGDTPAELEPALRLALEDSVRRPALQALLGDGAWRPAEDALAALMAAVTDGRLMALRLPAPSERRRLVQPGRAAEDLPEIVHLAQAALGPAAEALVLARPEAGGAARDPLLDQAARVLAAWAMQGWVGAGAAVVAIETACRRPGGGAASLVAATRLREAARRLGEAEATAARAAVPLRAAAGLLGWSEMLAALAQMTPDFTWRMPPMPAGGGEAAAAPTEVAPAASAAAAPDPSELPGVDEALMAEMLREAAKNGTPFCIPCMAAA